VLASSGCFARVHTLEGLISKSSNHLTRDFSKKAFHLIMRNMSILLDGKGNLANWSNMQWAAVFATWGLSNSSSGPAGTLSYYLGTHFKVPHGTAGGVFIGKVSRLNHERDFTIMPIYMDGIQTRILHAVAKEKVKSCLRQ
jgi:alcohol dehydrogenase class IV